jgi:hypothetical protein
MVRHEGSTVAQFEQVSPAVFDHLIATTPSSKNLKKQLARFRPHRDDHCFVCREPLLVHGHFETPGFCTLVLGDLDASGIVDLRNPEGFDEGGLFIVIGNVTCRAFVNHYGKCSFIDGDLVASDVIVNSHEDSSLVVIGNLKTNFFYGQDIWAEVGGAADMEYGKGYCLPIGYKNAAREAIEPRYDPETSMKLLAVGKSENAYLEGEIVAALKQGRSIFKSAV